MTRFRIRLILAKAYRKDGRVKDSIKILESVVEAQAKTLKQEDHDRLASEFELATAYFDDERFGDAIESLQQVVEVQKDTIHEENHKHHSSLDLLKDARKRLEAEQEMSALENRGRTEDTASISIGAVA